MDWYYYLHTNGSIISKHPCVVKSDPEYFNSPFVKKVYHIKSLVDFKNMLDECARLGAKPEEIAELRRLYANTK